MSDAVRALGKHKVVFDDLFRNMVAAGEAGGVLDEILMRLATYVEKADALKRKVQSAMVCRPWCSPWPWATIFMLMFIIPTFAKIHGLRRATSTKIVLRMSTSAA
jgi:type IV pilus assembly protein PilC